MKILMASADDGNRGLAVLAFKNLNAANSIDFVTTVDELMNYMKVRTNIGHELPDLLLYGLSVKDRDVLKEIHLDSRFANVKVITFSIHSYTGNENANQQDSNFQVYRASRSEEFNWILKEICDGLIAKRGWQYSASRSVSASM